jgi:hypothetical protein
MASTTVDPKIKAIQDALKEAGYDVTTAPDSSLVNEWEKHFIPQVDYNAYFDALINAAKAEYGSTDPEVGHYVAQKAAWENWSKDPSHATLTGVDLSNSGGKTYTDLAQQANTVKQTLAEQTKALNDAAKLGTSALTSSLYGAGTADNPAKKSIAANYKDAQTALINAQNAVAKKDTPKAQATLEKTQTAFNTNKTAFDAAQQAITDNAKGGLTPAEKAITGAYDAYLTKAYTPYTNLLSGTVIPAGGTQADATKISVDKALEFYKTNGYMPTVDSAVLGQVQTAISNYEQQKIKDKQLEKAQAVAAASPKEIGQTQKDISSYNALIAQAAKNAPAVAESTTDVLKKMKEAKGETTQGMSMPDILKRTGAQAGVTPPQAQQSQVPQLGLKLSQDFNTRMTQQDLAAQQQLQRPGTYAAGQFDPFYSGYLGVGNNYATEDSPMLPGGIWAGGPQVMTPSKVGFGIQNAYDPNAYTAADLADKPVNPSTVVGKAAGGYLDAQSVGQGNQALQQQPQQQNNQLGLASIPNMSQYTNYIGNPGMTSPTQNTDDGGVGGISVLGQTNPVW